MQNPYSDMAPRSFWKSGVASHVLSDRKYSELAQLPAIDQYTKCISVGSCFAQYMGEWLTNSHFTYLQSAIDTQTTTSFALGNVYTPQTLIQWIGFASAALTDEAVCETYFQQDQKFYDLLRPQQTNGFDSLDALQASRTAVATEVVEQIKQADVLFFTLGLTETWLDSYGIVYPICPAALFDVTRDYDFHNYSYSEICAQLQSLINELRDINPDLKIVFTVSPVPLTATATDNHVLVATCHSKSILRAAVSDVLDSNADLYYFPAYEIVTAPRQHDIHFNENLRTVSETAAHKVRDHLLDALNIKPVTQVSAIIDAVCDEEILDPGLLSAETETQPVTLLGDSHMGKLSKALNRADMAHCGGAVMNGSAFAQRKFVTCPEEYMVPLENAKSRRVWSHIVANLTRVEEHKINNSLVVTNIGLQTHQTGMLFFKWLQRENKQGQVTLQDFADYFTSQQRPQIDILLGLKARGHRVVVVSDPPFGQFFIENATLVGLIEIYFKGISLVLEQLGIEYLNAADMFVRQVDQPESYALGKEDEAGAFDWIHGNDAYYDWLANILSMQFIDVKKCSNDSKAFPGSAVN